VTTGILGGTFDPPHNGHVALARAALAELPIDRLVVLVAARPGHRGDVLAGPDDRLALARVAFDGLALEVDLDPHPFTADSVRGGRFGDAIFVVGADEGRDFRTGMSRTRSCAGSASRSARGRATHRPTSSATATAFSASSSTRPPSPPVTCVNESRRASLSSDWFRKPSSGKSRSAASTATLVASRKGLDEPLTPIEHARRIAGLAQEKLAQDVLILDMRPVCSYTDFFVLATGQNPRQTKAIWDEVHVRLKQDERALPTSVAGEPEGRWIVADYLDVVLHVFTPEAREYYRLEELWGDVPSIELDAAAV